MIEPLFESDFRYLTGNEPFPWQRRLYERFLSDDIPDACDLPTGLGKTAVIPIWLLAFARRARAGFTHGFPRRLVYVVNRRTVVDQATATVERMRDALARPELAHVADVLRRFDLDGSAGLIGISTLRGEHLDNAEWRRNPALPAVIIGTVDMVGSRLLFSGYGCGFKSRPLHAGFIGQDVLLIHDEAHLEPAFQKLIEGICALQHEHERAAFRCMAMTATSRSGGNEFRLGETDLANDLVAKRLLSRKGIAFHALHDPKKLAERLVELAVAQASSKAAILIYARDVETVQQTCALLEKKGAASLSLTGTMRGYERERLMKEEPRFQRFLAGGHGDEAVFLAATSAGEVGIDMSADHMVCDLTTYDSMAQRLGRVNRFGSGDALIDIVHIDTGTKIEPHESSSTDKAGSLTDFERARRATLRALKALPVRKDGRYDASPAALSGLPADIKAAGYSPLPVILPLTDVLLDAWSLTSIREAMPGRPPVAEWLHGKAEWEPPETRVAWRHEVSWLESLDDVAISEIIDDYPLKPHEWLTDRSTRVKSELKKLVRRMGDARVILVDAGAALTRPWLSELVEDNDTTRLDNALLILSPEMGGLRSGFLRGDAAYDESEQYDVADEWSAADGTRWRVRTQDPDDPARSGMRLVRAIETGDTAMSEQDEESNYRYWFVRSKRADDDGSKAARFDQHLHEHAAATAQHLSAIAERLGLSSTERTALRYAAEMHDEGKGRGVWQRSIGNFDPSVVLAKSSRSGIKDLGHYRHELGSLISASASCPLEADARELALHVIAAHHGRARPAFAAAEQFDPGSKNATIAIEAAAAAARRFAVLQRLHGRWRLAWLESLLRAADALASESVQTPGSPTAFSTEIRA